MLTGNRFTTEELRGYFSPNFSGVTILGIRTEARTSVWRHHVADDPQGIGRCPKIVRTGGTA
jgi:hypothetical protein